MCNPPRLLEYMQKTLSYLCKVTKNSCLVLTLQDYSRRKTYILCSVPFQNSSKCSKLYFNSLCSKQSSKSVITTHGLPVFVSFIHRYVRMSFVNGIYFNNFTEI